MTHSFRVLDQLEAELVRVARDPRSPRRALARRRLPGGRRHRLALILAVVLLLLAGATLALATSGVILTGASVPPTPATPSAGAGLPLPGQSRLLSVRVPDPVGGLPWGMRLVHTTRGLACVQIGRVSEGRLGELGLDGAYGDDGRFHPVGPGVLPSYAGAAAEGGVTSERGSCVLAYGDVTGGGQAWGSAVVAEFQGADENAAFTRRTVGLLQRRRPRQFARRTGRVLQGRRRQILYGILGPKAVSVTYRAGSELRVVPVVPGVGAYLIVLPEKTPSERESQGEAPGTDVPGEGPGTAGPLVAITYSTQGRTCENGSDAETGSSFAVKHACPPPNPYPASLRVTPPGSFVRTPTATFQTRGNQVTAAIISIADAPFAVTSAAEGYAVSTSACGPRAEGVRSAVLDENVAASARVSIRIEYPFSDPCTRNGVQAQVIYQAAGPDAKRSYGRAPGELVIGAVTLRLPPGDVGAQPPGARPSRLARAR
jgi:hypothetical protein